MPAKKRSTSGERRREPASLTRLREAAANDDPEALDELAMHYRDGLRDKRGRWLIRRNAGVSIRLFRRAAHLGHAPAMHGLAHGLTDFPVRAAQVRAANAWYRKAFTLGYSIAGYNLAVTYQNLGRHRDAVAWFRRTAAAGEADALLPLAEAELLGLGTRRNVPAALEKLRRVAGADGFVTVVSPLEQERAMLLLADVLSSGWVVPRDFKAALRWLRRAARFGSAAAAGLLADLGES